MAKKQIEKFESEVSNIQKELEGLKTTTLSESEKKSKKEEIRRRVESLKQKIQTKIDSLKGKTDEEAMKEKEKAETLLKTLTDILSLQLSIGNPETTESKTDTENGEKGFFTIAKERIGEQWNDVWDREKWKTEGGKNLLRTAGFFATGVGAVALVYKGVKKIWDWAFGDKEENDEEEAPKQKKKKKSSRWKKGLAAIGMGIAGYFGYRNWDKVKEFGGSIWDKIKGWFEKEKPLEIDEAVKSATSEVRNGKIKENPFRQYFEGGIKFNEGDSTIESYGEATKIDVESKTIEGLKNIKFPNYEELVHAANIINFARRNFAGKCQSSEPFAISDGGGGDLVVQLANGEKPEWISASDSNLWTKILGVGGCAVGTALGAYIGGIKGAVGLGATLGLGGLAAGDYLDNDSSVGNNAGTVAAGENLKRFKNCLNDQKNSSGKSLWPKKSQQEVNPDNASPIEEELNEVIGDIESSGGEGIGGRNLVVEQDKENPEIFTIGSYGQRVNITLKGCVQKGHEHINYSKLKNIKIGKYKESDRGDGLDIDFPHNKEGLKECIRVANLTNFIRGNNEYAGNGGENFPFGVGLYYMTHGGGLDIDTKGRRGVQILSPKTLKEKFPTLFKDLSKQLYANPKQDKLRDQAFNDHDIEPKYKSQYIKYLHQMRNEFDSQPYWTNGQQ